MAAVFFVLELVVGLAEIPSTTVVEERVQVEPVGVAVPVAALKDSMTAAAEQIQVELVAVVSDCLVVVHVVVVGF